MAKQWIATTRSKDEDYTIFHICIPSVALRYIEENVFSFYVLHFGLLSLITLMLPVDPDNMYTLSKQLKLSTLQPKCILFFPHLL